jgi:DNA-binding response OmpR family regulator
MEGQMHALIIEPRGLISFLLEDELRELGFTSFDTAPTYDSAVEAARKKPPNLITASLHLAQGNGVDAVRAICSNQAIPTVFIVSDAEEAKPVVGDAPVVKKPISKARLHRAVQRAMQTG